MTSAVLDNPGSSSALLRMRKEQRSEPLEPQAAPSGRSFAESVKTALFDPNIRELNPAKLPYPQALTYRLADQIQALDYQDYRFLLGKLLNYEAAAGAWNNEVERLDKLVKRRDQVKAGAENAPHTDMRVPAEHNLELIGGNISAIQENLDRSPLPRIKDLFREILTGQRLIGGNRTYDAIANAISVVDIDRNYSQKLKDCINTCAELLYSSGCDQYKEIIRPAPDHKGYPILHDKSFAGDLRVLLRLAYPGGVNVANPANEPGEVSSFSATDKVTINWCGNCILIQPHPGRAGVSTVAVVEGNASETLNLQDGKPLLIGRELKITSLFNQTVKLSGLNIAADLNLSSTQVSRAALEICKLGDRIYVYDRGSKNPIEVAQEGDRLLTMVYKPEIQGNGIGHTVWEIKPRSR